MKCSFIIYKPESPTIPQWLRSRVPLHHSSLWGICASFGGSAHYFQLEHYLPGKNMMNNRQRHPFFFSWMPREKLDPCKDHLLNPACNPG